MTRKGRPMRILNLYAGIGGNRKLWEDCEVTAVEFDENIARAYQERYPDDKVIVGDAQQYLLEHYKEFDFIWASPPCQSHSDIRRMGAMSGQYKPILPDMTMYSMIIFLETFCEGLYCIENVIPYYTPLVRPSAQIDRHLYWSNFRITEVSIEKDRIHQNVSGAEWSDLGINGDGIKNKRQVIRNQVNYEIGKHILNCAMGVETKQDGPSLLDFIEVTS